MVMWAYNSGGGGESLYPADGGEVWSQYKKIVWR